MFIDALEFLVFVYLHKISRMKKMMTVILFFVAANEMLAQSLNTHNSFGFPLAGTWLLKAAKAKLPDGTLITDTSYGINAKGILFVDNEGQYSLQIFRPGRQKFASGDKLQGTPDEYRAALLGISTHTGHIKIDTVSHTLQFSIDNAAYPNWEGTTQTRSFTLTGNELYYEVPSKAAGGNVAVSIWLRKN
jgi:hypothetical protein